MTILDGPLSGRRNRRLAYGQAGVDLPYALGFVNKEEQTITVDLTKKQIEKAHP